MMDCRKIDAMGADIVRPNKFGLIPDAKDEKPLCASL